MGPRQTRRRGKETPVVFPAIPWLVDGNRFEPLLESALAHVKAQKCPNVKILSPFLTEPYPRGTKFTARETMGLLNPKLNEIIEAFLDTSATHLWFVDADAEVPPDALCELLSLDVDVASGVSPPHHTMRKSTALKWMPAPSPEYDWSRPWYKPFLMKEVLGKIIGGDQVVATGHFCMLCKRRVFEWFSPLYMPLRFIYEPPTRITNEVLFWQMAQELGFICRIHGGVLCGHLPEFPLEELQKEFKQ